MDELYEHVEEDVNQSLTLPGVDHVALEDMFPAEFIEEGTEFSSIDELLTAYRNEADPDNPLGPRFDDFIQSHSDFGSWNNMRQQAEMGFLEDHLG